MSEETYYCHKCGRNHKVNSKKGIAHKSYSVDGEPGGAPVTGRTEFAKGGQSPPEEISPQTGPGAGSSGEEPENPLEQVLTTLFNNQRNLAEDIKILNENLERMGGVITTLTQGETRQQPQMGWDGLGDEWNKLPPKLQDAVTGFLGNIGRAAVRFAGAGGDDEGEDIDERLTRLIVKRRRVKIEENLLAGAETVLNMIDDADMELYAKPKEAKQDG